jgi:hypothetical protein
MKKITGNNPLIKFPKFFYSKNHYRFENNPSLGPYPESVKYNHVFIFRSFQIKLTQKIREAVMFQNYIRNVILLNLSQSTKYRDVLLGFSRPFQENS